MPMFPETFEFELLPTDGGRVPNDKESAVEDACERVTGLGSLCHEGKLWLFKVESEEAERYRLDFDNGRYRAEIMP